MIVIRLIIVSESLCGCIDALAQVKFILAQKQPLPESLAQLVKDKSAWPNLPIGRQKLLRYVAINNRVFMLTCTIRTTLLKICFDFTANRSTQFLLREQKTVAVMGDKIGILTHRDSCIWVLCLSKYLIRVHDKMCSELHIDWVEILYSEACLWQKMWRL